MRAFASACTRWPFLLALGLLPLNDFLLKPQYPGFITGKLSDFAGVALIALPLFAAFPGRARTIYLAIAVALLWWKSPASASFIEFANTRLPWGMQRTVDYGDLLALGVLPLCRVVAAHAELRSLHSWRRMLLIPVLPAAMFAVMATAKREDHDDYAFRTVDPSGQLPHAAAAHSIDFVAKAHGMECSTCTVPEIQGNYGNQDKELYLNYSFPAKNAVAIEIYWSPGLFGNGAQREAREMRDELKGEFAARFQGLEFVEKLKEAPGG